MTQAEASKLGMGRSLSRGGLVRVCILLLLPTSLAACSGSSGCGSTAPCGTVRSAAEAVAGSWTEVETWRGISMRISLAARDTTLSGTAIYSTHTSTEGTASIAGYVFWQDAANVPSGHVMPAHPVVVLNFAFANGTSAPFDEAVLQGQDTLSGALTFSDAPFSTYGTSFVRAAQ